MKPLSDQELEALLNGGESDCVEFKENLREEAARKTACQAVCAFANDLPNHNQPGLLFVGAKDDGTPSNLPITDELLRQLADIKANGNIVPLPVLFVKKRILKGAEMAVVTVMPSDMPPVRYRGRIHVRTGSRRDTANGQDERILNEKRKHKSIPYDIYPLPSTQVSIDDLSKTIFENEYLPAAFATDVLEANDRSYEERLASCKMITSPDDPTPTILGLLSIGKRPRDVMSGAYIQFLRIDGTEMADEVIDEEDIGGTLVGMLHRAEEKLRAHNRVSMDITTAPTHTKEALYPHAAILQILYNAVLHRTYESTNAPVRVYWFNNRIEIHSPGGPYGNVTLDNFAQPGITDYRNPNIADVLKTFGFIQAFGRGIAITQKAMQENGNPPAKFETNSSAVVCILRGKP